MCARVAVLCEYTVYVIRRHARDVGCDLSKCRGRILLCDGQDLFLSDRFWPHGMSVCFGHVEGWYSTRSQQLCDTSIIVRLLSILLSERQMKIVSTVRGLIALLKPSAAPYLRSRVATAGSVVEYSVDHTILVDTTQRIISDFDLTVTAISM